MVEEHEQEITTDKLMDLHHEQQQEIIQGISSGKEDDNTTKKFLSSNTIREMCEIKKTLKFFLIQTSPKSPK